MPTQTFFNLSQAKRRRIEDKARDVFLKTPYNKVSISQIVYAVNIPRGSFYQYFENLEDLYQYLYTQTIAHYEEFTFNQLAQATNAELFTYMRASFKVDFDFLKSSDYFELMRKFFKERHMIGINVELNEARRNQFHESCLDKLDITAIEHLTHEKRLKTMRLMHHLKFQMIHKSINQRATFEEAYKDYRFYLQLIEHGAKGVDTDEGDL